MESIASLPLAVLLLLVVDEVGGRAVAPLLSLSDEEPGEGVVVVTTVVAPL